MADLVVCGRMEKWEKIRRGALVQLQPEGKNDVVVFWLVWVIFQRMTRGEKRKGERRRLLLEKWCFPANMCPDLMVLQWVRGERGEKER
ncbi:hypothetical protein HAX54_018643, partial [Datura stramonium]|nr:hypothetical protein [Datura stramonium]